MSKNKNNDELNNDFIDITLSNNDTLRDKIHDIHNFLRNSGVGYGMTALKIFNIFYGLKKLELNGNFEKTGLDKLCKFSNIYKSFNTSDISKIERAYEVFISKIVNDELYNNNKLDFLFYLIPNSIKGETIKQLIILIEELCNIENKLNVQLSGKIYEYFIGRDESAISELGAYFTDRHITKYIYEDLLNPDLDDNSNVYSMVDMFGGSGGFTVGYIDFLKNKYDDIEWKTQIKKVNHFDMNEDVIKSAMLEFYCLTGEFSHKNNMKCINSFQYDFGHKKYHYIVTNPPYGGDKNKKSEHVIHLELIKKEIETEFKNKYNVKNMKELTKKEISKVDTITIKQYEAICKKLKKIESEKNEKNVNLGTSHDIYKEYAEKYGLSGNDKEAVSLIMMMVLLEENGTAIGVLKEGIFFDKKYKALRKCLTNNFNVRKIVSIPADQFENTTTKTSIIMFENTKEKTKKIDFYNLVIEKDDKTTVIKNNDGIYKIEKIKDKIREVYHERTSSGNLDEIIEKKYSFNSKDYNKEEIRCGVNYELVKLKNLTKYLPTTKHYTSIGKDKGKYRFYNSSQDKKLYVDFCEVKDYSIILGQGGNFNIHYDKNFTASKHVCVLQSLDNDIKKLKYLYYIIPKVQSLFITNGSTISWLNKKNIENMKVPIPKSNDKIKDWVDKISKPYDKMNNKIEELSNLEIKIQNKINDICINEDCDDVNLSDICEIYSGKPINKNNRNGSKYPYYAANGISGYVDEYLFNGKYIICAQDGSIGATHLVDTTFYASNHVWVLKCNIIEYYVYTILKNCVNYEELVSGSVIPKLTKDKLSNINIKVPKNKNLLKNVESEYKKIENLQEEIKKTSDIYEKYIKELSEEAILKEVEISNNLIEESDNEEVIDEIVIEKAIKKKKKKNKVKSKQINVDI